jgi:Holliday junction resolvase RusA-like endonuclease
MIIWKSYPITPVPKPRQTRSDRWKKRPCVMRYRAFADKCKLLIGVDGLKTGDHVRFWLPMPKSWSAQERADACGEPHEGKPDLDNMLKALMDALVKKDEKISCFGGVVKRWAPTGSGRIDIGRESEGV